MLLAGLRVAVMLLYFNGYASLGSCLVGLAAALPARHSAMAQAGAWTLVSSHHWTSSQFLFRPPN